MKLEVNFDENEVKQDNDSVIFTKNKKIDYIDVEAANVNQNEVPEISTTNRISKQNLAIKNTRSNTRQNDSGSQPYFLVKEIPEVELEEDFVMHTLNLSTYAADNEDPTEDLHWFITNDNKSLINVTHENSTDQKIILRSVTNAYGVDEVKLWVSDTTGRMDFKTFTIRIKPKNDLPTISNLPELMVHDSKPYSIDLEPYIVDYDTPVSQIDIKIKPEGRDREFASISNTILRLDFKSTTDFVKDYITLELNDKINTSFVKIQIKLEDNYPPEQLKTIPNIILYSGEPLNKILDLDFYFTDPDDNKKSLTYEYFKNNNLKININDDNTVDIDSGSNWEGKDKIIIRCKDPQGAFKEQIINITVTSKHLSIGLSNLPDLQVHYDCAYKFNLTPYIQLEAPTIEYYFEIYEFIGNTWIKSTKRSNIILDSKEDNLLKINYSEQYINKTIPVFIYISDGETKQFQEFLIKITDNYPPILKKTFPDQTFDEDQLNYSVIDLYEFFCGIENGTLEFSEIAENIILDIEVNGLMTINSKPDWFGQERVIIRAQDRSGAMVEDSFLVTLNPINDPPKIFQIPEINITVGVKNTLEYMKYLHDVDNNISELNVQVDSKYITLAGGFLIFDFPTDFDGERDFTITVDDGELSSKQLVTLKISHPQDDASADEGVVSPTIFWGMLIVLIIMIISLLIIGLVYINRLRAFRFDEVFLIYKDGLLIAHTSRIKKSSQDSDIISSMFTAVQDFIHDSFSDPKRAPESWPLKRLDFGDFKIVIDRGDYIYIAVVFSGFPLRNKLLQIEKLRKDIEKKYADVLPTWSGDMDSLKGTQEMIDELLYSTGGSQDEEKLKQPKFYDEPPEDEEIVDIDDEFEFLDEKDTSVVSSDELDKSERKTK